jgi:aromatic ring-opening dioxygenase catalytic subunit (LigB family)
MGKLIAGAASSHAFALEEPRNWDTVRNRVRDFYTKRYGAPPPDHPRMQAESEEDVQQRYGNLAAAFEHIRRRLAEARPDVIVLVADDQDETFTEDTYPQIAVYLGEQFICRGRHQYTDHVVRGHPEAARAILTEAVTSDIDMSSIGQLPDGVLLAHAFGPVLKKIDPEAAIPAVPVFVNCIHLPAPSPARCWLLGQAIKRAIEGCPGVNTAAIVGSGGLSHFPASYPGYPKGDFPFGGIVEEFDHMLLDKLRAGKGSELARLTSQELLENGEIELRSWITMLGAIGDHKPELLVYEPFYRGIMGMGIGYWNLGGGNGA